MPACLWIGFGWIYMDSQLSWHPSSAIFPGAPHLDSNSILATAVLVLDPGASWCHWSLSYGVGTVFGEYPRSITLHNTSHTYLIWIQMISHMVITYIYNYIYTHMYHRCIMYLIWYIHEIYIHRTYEIYSLYMFCICFPLRVFNVSHWGHLLCHGNLLLGVVPAPLSHLGLHAAQPDGQSQHFFAHGSSLAGNS